MMKKITRIAALLAATAFLLAGFPACSDEDDDEPTLEKIEISIGENAKTVYEVGEEFDKTGITVTATYSDGNTKDVTADATLMAKTADGNAFTTATAGTYEVTLTATYEGKEASSGPHTIKVKASGGEEEEKPTPPEEGGGGVTNPPEEGEGDGDGEGNPENPPEKIPEGLTVAKNVTDEAVTETGWYQTTANTSGNIVQQTADGVISVNIKDNTCPTPEYILKDAMNGAVKITATFNITKAGNSCGIMEILDAGGTGLFQPARINSYSDSGITITTRVGSTDTGKSPAIALGTNFTVETIINFDAEKFQTKVDSTTLPVQTFSGKDKALKAIKFNPKTSGTVMTISGVAVTEVAEDAIPDDLKPTVFKSETKTVQNDEATLGIVATDVESSDETVATVEKTDDGIVITSVKPGKATITAKAADDKSAKITVTVADDGSIKTIVIPYKEQGAEKTYTLDMTNISTLSSETLINDVFYGLNGVKSETLKISTASDGGSWTEVSKQKQISLTGGKAAISANGIKITTTGSAKFVMHVGSKSDKTVQISVLNSDGKSATCKDITKNGTAANTFDNASTTSIDTYTFTIETPGTYVIGGTGGGLYVFGMEVTF